MIFIPLVNILNISIILMMIIVFFNYSSAKPPKPKPIPKLFQLVIHDDTNYDTYYTRELRPEEKKMSIHEFYQSKYNLDAMRIPKPTDKSLKDQKEKINTYCSQPPNQEDQDIHNSKIYYDPAYLTNQYCKRAFEKLVYALFTCLSHDLDTSMTPSYIYQNVPFVLTTTLKNALKNQEESDATKTTCCSKLKFWNYWKTEETLHVKGVISKIGQVFKKNKEKAIEIENNFYTCMMKFKNGVTELNKKIRKCTPESISKDDYKKLTNRCKTIYNTEIMILDDYDQLSNEKSKLYKIKENQKKKILEYNEIKFLEELCDHSSKIVSYSYWQSVFTDGYLVKEHKKDDQKTDLSICISGIETMDELHFKVTKLIYPSIDEINVFKYKEKRKNIIKNLKLLDKYFNKNYKNDESGQKRGNPKNTQDPPNKNNNHIYESYEQENMKVNDTFLRRLKTCRAIPREGYDTYILRLNNNDCVPLLKELWESEVNAMGSINVTELSEFKQIQINDCDS